MTLCVPPILPMLGRVAGAACTRTELTGRLRTWFATLPEPAKLVFDYQVDCDLLVDAFMGDGFDSPPPNMGDKLRFTADMVSDPVYQYAQNRTFAQN